MMEAKWICTRFGEMVTDRTSHEQTWKRIADVLRPLRGNMQQRSILTEGARRHQRVYDSSPLTALANFKAGLHGSLTNPAVKWFDLRIAGDKDVNDNLAVKVWREEVTRRLRLSFAPAMSGFYSQVSGLYADIGAFGSGVFFSREIIGQGRFHDVTISLEEAYFAEDQWGEVDTVCRMMRLTAKQAVEKFGEKVSTEVKDAARLHPGQRFEFIHYVGPNPGYKPGVLGPDGMAFGSYYVERAKEKMVMEERFRVLPYQCPRWDVAAGETYGRGQGEMALSDILSLNAARRTNLTAAERASNPTLLATDELALGQAARAVPGSTIYGGMGVDGKRRVDVLQEGKNLSISMEMENQIRDAVKDAFFFGLMQIQGSADMTATEFLGRQNERLRLLGPHLGRLESEFLTPLIRRRFQMLDMAGQLPPPPEEISEMPLEVQYISPLARMQRTQEAEAAMRTFTGIAGYAELDPSIMDRVDPNKFAEVLDEGFGSGILRSREEAEIISQARQQQQQQQAMVEAAPQLAKAGKDAAQASQVANAA